MQCLSEMVLKNKNLYLQKNAIIVLLKCYEDNMNVLIKMREGAKKCREKEEKANVWNWIPH